MGSKPNFHPSLQLRDPHKKLPNGKRPGPIAGGLIEKGDEVKWVYVWIIQNGESMKGRSGWAAAADGESPDDTPFTGEWRVETEIPDDSDEFSTDIAAVGTAMALIERKDKSLDVYWWTDAVNLRPPRRRPATKRPRKTSAT
jgi:hypothetical protein